MRDPVPDPVLDPKGPGVLAVIAALCLLALPVALFFSGTVAIGLAFLALVCIVLAVALGNTERGL